MVARVLAVRQSPLTDLGRVGEAVRRRGYELAVHHPNEGESLPDPDAGYAAVVVFGGPMSANDDHLPGIRAQLKWIPRVVEAGVPFLGICLGSQLLARALGARVSPHAGGMAEIGYFEAEPTPAGAALFDAPPKVYHWHLEGFELPAGGVRLLQGERFPNQAFALGPRCYGVQFHPEVTRDIIEDWSTRSAHQLALPGAQARDHQLEAHARWDWAPAPWFHRLVDAWLPPA